MVSKHLAVSFALAVASTLGEQCQLSSGGGTAIMGDIDTLVNDNSAFYYQLNHWDGTNTGFGTAYNTLSLLTNDVNTVGDDLGGKYGSTDCDEQTVAAALASALPAIGNSLDVLASLYSKLGLAGVWLDGVETQIDSLAQAILLLNTNTYGSYLSCDYVGQTFAPMDSLLESLYNCSSAFQMGSYSYPAHPQTCGGSTTTTTSVTTPTSPPTCKKQVIQRAD
ncbi:hypothetical protein TRVA0_048S00144 [Trichomonascus vanleenenianus]|uniref:uncharacterized protein n=1 Tax=Trichomonascus vanleenenianus TaxID=2268995 RepID=UPI003ECA265E